MCTYAYRIPFYYYSWEPFNHNFVVGQVDTDAGTCTGGGTYDPAGQTCDFGDWVGGASGVRSKYDYTSVDGPNCAEGYYNLVVTTDSKPTASSGKFGGKMSNCADGPAIRGISGWPKDKDGYPMWKINVVNKQGLNELWEIPPLSTFEKYNNFFLANGFNYDFNFLGGANQFEGL